MLSMNYIYIHLNAACMLDQAKYDSELVVPDIPMTIGG